jgi:hypothetical protein
MCCTVGHADYPDARKLAQPASRLLREQLVRAAKGGMAQTAAAGTFGASLRAVNKRMALERRRGSGALTLERRRAGSGALSTAQATGFRRLVVGELPDQLTVPFYRWR